ncbi:MAG: ArnT family glycosyltransferase, partial [Chthoniobacterales bacterium]
MGKDSAAIGLRWELRDIGIIGCLAVVLWAVVAAWIASLVGILIPAFFWIWWGIFFVGATAGGVVAWRQGARIERMARWQWDEVVLAALLVSLLALSLGMAICSPPNNADSLIYHLPRQIFWMAQGSVFGAEVPNPHMTKMPPLSELLGLNLYILLGTDRWHSLVQLFGLLGALAVLGRVIELVGGSRRAQLAGCVFFASVPTVFFEASNTKNDILVAFFLLTVAWSLAHAVLARRLRLEDAVIAGVGCGFALLTKGTAIAYLPVLAGAFLVVVIVARVKLPLVSMSVGALLVALLAAPHYLSQMTQIAAAESGESSSHANATIHPAAGGAVLVQNLALQLALPDSQWNERVAQVATYVSERLGYPPNDSRITFMETQFAVVWHPEHEDRATAFLHWMLLLGSVTVGWVWCPPGRRRSALLFGMTALGMLVVFSLLFRWQPWHGRLLIPCLGFGAVSVGLMVAEAGRCVTVLLMTLCGAWLFPSMTNSHRPVVGPRSVFRTPDADVLRTIDVPEDAEAVRAAREVFRTIQPDRVLLRFEGDGIVHPMLRELKQAGRPWPKLLLRPPEDGAVDVV